MERKQLHFIGIGGVGVAGLAHLAADLGYEVTGSDAAPSAMLDSLRQRGLNVSDAHLPALPGLPSTVIYSSAIPEDNAELADARRRGIPCMRRGEYLGVLARHFKTVVAVAGSHGKTSTTAMLAHICRKAGLNPGYLVGGKVNGWERSACAGDGSLFITEVDESDGTQVYTHATLAIIVNVEDDHCWGFGGVEKLEQCFTEFAGNAQAVLSWSSPSTRRLFGAMPSARLLDEADMPENLRLPLPGRHWRINAALAVAAAEALGIPRNEAVSGLEDFPGVDRRLSVRGTVLGGRCVVVEDYAHHPTELRATLAALRDGYPGRRLLVVFQPHRFERVRRFGHDFAELLGTADHAWVVAPFSAWVADGDGVDASSIAAQTPGGRAEYVQNLPETIAAAVKHAAEQSGDDCVAVVIGAGDVSRIVPALLKA